jgi:threonine/homoserine/homoserine lactone efflux protein
LENYSAIILHFIVLGISLAAPIGPVKLEMIKHGLSGGFWPSWLVGLGATCADFFFMFSIFLGLSPFLHHRLIQIGMLIIGVLMLTYLGISTIKGCFTAKPLLNLSKTKGAKKPFWTGFIIALMNPFNFVFWFGVYGGALQSIPEQYDTLAVAGFSLFILGGIVLWNINIAFTIHFFRKLINETTIKFFSAAAGAGLLIFACHLLVKLSSYY